MSIGLTPKVFPHNKQPGWTKKCPNSFGYNFQGFLMNNKNNVHTHTKIEKGVFIGCGFNTARRVIFFTYNKELVSGLNRLSIPGY